MARRISLELVVIGVVLSGIRLVKDVPYTGDRHIDVVGGVFSVLGMGGIVLGILAWEGGGGPVLLLMVIGVVGFASLAWWLVRRKRRSEVPLIDPDLFKSIQFRLGISGQTLQQIALGGSMIALPIFLQMVLEYNALQAGLSLMPLSLSMFAIARARRPSLRRAEAPVGHDHPDRLRARRRWARCRSFRSCRASTPACGSRRR